MQWRTRTVWFLQSMSALAVVLAGVALLHPAVADATEEDTSIFVMRLAAEGAATASDADYLTDLTAEHVLKVTGRSVRTEMETQAERDDAIDAAPAWCGQDRACALNLARRLGYVVVVMGVVRRTDGQWSLSLVNLEARTGEEINQAMRIRKGSRKLLEDATPPVVEELFGRRPRVTDPMTIDAPLGEGQVARRPPWTLSAQRAEAVVGGETTPLSIASDAQKPRPKLRWAAWGVMGGGALLLALGGVANMEMWKYSRTYEHTYRASALDQHSTWKTLTITGYAAGGAALLTGAGLWVADLVLSRKSASAPRAETPAATTIGVGVGPDGEGVTFLLQGSF